MTKKAGEKRNISKRRWILYFWSLYVLCILGFVFVFLLASWGAFGTMPTFEQLENPQTNLATEVYSSDGEIIGKYYFQNRSPITYDQLSKYLVNALVATEDVRYFQHSGIDPWGTMRAIVFLGTEGGASTITQQLAKQMFHGEGSPNVFKRIIQKVKEWIIAVRLERDYTKQEIIAMYYNIYGFTNNAVGIRSAAHIYFGKTPKNLNIQEAAVLAGMFRNSALYNPLRNPVGVTNRRNVVFHQMAKAGYITEEEKDSLQKLPLKVDYHPQSHLNGLATYFRAYLRQFLKDWARENHKPDGSHYNIYSDGLKVYTTINSRMQAHAEAAVEAHMKELQAAFVRQNKHNPTAPFRGVTKAQIKGIITRGIHNSRRWKLMKTNDVPEDSILASFRKKREMHVFSWRDESGIDTVMTPLDSIRYSKSFLNAGMMSENPKTGGIKVWIGGIDFKYFKYDHVKQARRQVGSTFKPFVYATAIEQLHYSPCKKFPNSIYTIPKGRYGLLEDWSPHNAGKDEYGGMVTLKTALAKSLNTVAVRLIDKIGPQPVIDLLAKLGVDTTGIPAVPAIALGSVDMSVYEMVSAYSAFGNKGVYIKPFIVKRITDKNGTILYRHQPQTRDAMNAKSAYLTVNLMEGVTSDGTGRRLRTTGAKKWNPVYKQVVTGYPYAFKNPIAGKTGTTQNQSDGWFMGMVPDLCTGVWVGGDIRSVHFGNIAYGQGATMALPIWGLFMKKVYADDSLHVSTKDFEMPEGIDVNLDCDSAQQSADSLKTDDALQHLKLG